MIVLEVRTLGKKDPGQLFSFIIDEFRYYWEKLKGLSDGTVRTTVLNGMNLVRFQWLVTSQEVSGWLCQTLRHFDVLQPHSLKSPCLSIHVVQPCLQCGMVIELGHWVCQFEPNQWWTQFSLMCPIAMTSQYQYDSLLALYTNMPNILASAA